MEGGSWTNNISWVSGYEGVMGPMEGLSSLFYEKARKPGLPTSEPRYRKALFHLLTSQTSCYRYWGQGIFVDYGREVCRRGADILELMNSERADYRDHSITEATHAAPVHRLFGWRTNPQAALSRCRAASAKCRRLRNCQAAATAVRHVVIAAARSARCVWAEVRWRWTLKVL